jgi:hypothetical protein
MPRIVSNLLNEWRYSLGELVALLKVYDEPRLCLLSNFSKRLNVSFAVYGDTDDVGAMVPKELNLASGRGEVLCFRGAHGLHGDRTLAADNEVSNPYRPGLATSYSGAIVDGGE